MPVAFRDSRTDGRGRDVAILGARRPPWLTRPLLMVVLLTVGAGLAQFSVTTVIGDVAAHFGEQAQGDDLASELGMPATTIGLSLAIIRLSSLGALPITALGDRFGRRRMLLTAAVVGLGLTALAAAAPHYWVYVALVAAARLGLSTINNLNGVIVAEEVASRHRAWGLSLLAVAFGIGSGTVAVTRGLLPGDPSFRVVTAFALVPLLALPLLARAIREPRIATEALVDQGIPGRIPAGWRLRVLTLALLTGTLSVASGPAFTFLFVYGERVVGATPGQMSMLILASGPTGLLGVLAGRYGADRVGRRLTAAAAMALTGTAVFIGYSGGLAALVVGYLLTLAGAGAFSSPFGSLAAELVPTRARATAAGWMMVAGVLGGVGGLAAFGALADATGTFATAARLLGLGAATLCVGFALVPETRGMELDDEVPGDLAKGRRRHGPSARTAPPTPPPDDGR
jgi:MFS family permease